MVLRLSVSFFGLSALNHGSGRVQENFLEDGRRVFLFLRLFLLLAGASR
jgi:hypothetical protein